MEKLEKGSMDESVNSLLSENLLEILNDCKTMVKECYKAWLANDLKSSIEILGVIDETIKSVCVVAKNNYSDNSKIKLKDACTCILVSIVGIMKLIDANDNEVAWKIRYELLPIVETTYLQFLYWEFVYERPDLLSVYNEEIAASDMFNNIDKEIDLSIIITGYNHLDVTINAVESVLRELPQDINVELILHNHGSSDLTLAYFNSISQAHVFNVAINKAVPGAYVGSMRGKVRMHVSNDVVMGINSIKNMYRTVTEDMSIGWLVPSTANISNYQNIEMSYENEEGFINASKKNNVYDVRRHERRARLCNPIEVFTADVAFKMYKDMYVEIMCSENIKSFPDDKISLWMRRNGYKMILQKDAYCHHIGSVTMAEEVNSANGNFYDEGRRAFADKFGIDPWDKGRCYDIFFYNGRQPEYEGEDSLFILGVNCGLGSDSLKVKENLKEQGAKNLTLVNITDEDKYIRDLQGISDEAYCYDSLSKYIDEHNIKKIDYIVVDSYEGGLDALLQEIEASKLIVKKVYFMLEPGQWAIGSA